MDYSVLQFFLGAMLMSFAHAQRHHHFTASPAVYLHRGLHQAPVLVSQPLRTPHVAHVVNVPPVTVPAVPAASPRAAGPVEPDYYGPPQPYSFSYDTHDEFGNRQHREETSDSSGAKRGSYGYTDANGLYRTVTYVADANGFRASISTNEPGTASGPTGDAIFDAKPIQVPYTPTTTTSSRGTIVRSVPVVTTVPGRRVVTGERLIHHHGHYPHRHYPASHYHYPHTHSHYMDYVYGPSYNHFQSHFQTPYAHYDTHTHKKA